MNLDDEICLCFHVTVRKVRNYIRLEKPRRPGQLSECFGAGTGCGWCRPYLEMLFQQAGRDGVQPENQHPLPSAAEYAQGRSRFVRDGGGVPPPTPLPPPTNRDADDQAD
jgi:bacterioferritin-associated ferredoxin